MRAFVVHLNGKRLCTAGIGDDGVMSANVTWVRHAPRRARPTRNGGVDEELGLMVGGLITKSGEHVTWRPRRLRVGDEVRINVVEIGRVSKPHRRERRDPARDLAQQKAYVRGLAKQLGWKISTRASG
jgi:hypothetical protein